MAIEELVDKEIADSFDPALRKSFEVNDEVEDVKDYDKVRIKKDSILLSGDKMFYTLQGEGPTMGLPAIFVRLHVCNLRCTWCDAFYTWDGSSKEFWTESTRMSFEKCALEISATWGCEVPDSILDRDRIVVWTGGEPLIQKSQIQQVCKVLDETAAGDVFYKYEIETNGTLMPTEYMLRFFQFNCSPKLSNSENQHHSMVKPKVLHALAEANSTFKFVCRDEEDLNEIEEKYLPHIYREQVIIMPEGITSIEIDNHMKDLAEPCKDRGYRLLGRMQAQAWDGARRGV